MTKENELLNFFKVAYANYPIDKNYLYKLVKETPEIITAFDPHRSGYYPASSSYIKWWMSYLNCSDNDCYLIVILITKKLWLQLLIHLMMRVTILLIVFVVT